MASSSARIIVLPLNYPDLDILAPILDEYNLLGPAAGYVFVGGDGWLGSYESPPTSKSVIKLYTGSIGTRPSTALNSIAIKLQQACAAISPLCKTADPYLFTSYDLVYAVVNAINASLSNPSGPNLYNQFINQPPFYGATGMVQFNTKGDPLAAYDLINGDATELKVYGQWIQADNTAGFTIANNGYQPIYPSGSSTIPSDAVNPTLWKLPALTTSLTQAFAAIGIFLVVLTSILFIRYRQMTMLRSLSPPFLLAILFGLGIILLSAFIFPNPNPTSSTCSASVWLCVTGFWIAFTPLFSKIYRIYRIFEQVTMRIVKISNTYLAIFCFILTSANLIILAVWQSMDPVTARTFTTNKVDTLTSLPYVEIGLMCSPNALTFPAIVLGAMGLLLLVGCVLAFSIRRVEDRFNESKTIALSIYNIAFSLVILIPVALSNDNNFTLANSVTSFILVWIPISTWAILFANKTWVLLSAIYRYHIAPKIFGTERAASETANSKRSSFKSNNKGALSQNDESGDSDFLAVTAGKNKSRNSSNGSQMNFNIHVLNLHELSPEVLNAYIPFLEDYLNRARALLRNDIGSAQKRKEKSEIEIGGNQNASGLGVGGIGGGKSPRGISKPDLLHGSSMRDVGSPVGTGLLRQTSGLLQQTDARSSTIAVMSDPSVGTGIGAGVSLSPVAKNKI